MVVYHLLENRTRQRHSYCSRGHPLQGDNLVPSSRSRRCRECCRIYQWLLRRGLKMSEFSPEKLQALVPPRWC
jgi:hypothetical protein